MTSFWEHLHQLVSAGTPFVAVTVVDVVASAPGAVGAKMLVTEQGLAFGTVGGGKLELLALAEAKAMLAEAKTATPTRFVEWNLQKDVGTTCGGAVRLFFEAYNLANWKVVIFGAGHCAQALVRLLLTLQCHVTVIDPRPEWLAKLPAVDDGRLRTVRAEGPMEGYVRDLPAGAFVVVMTTGHISDQPILLEILKSRAGDFKYVGVIGSRTKAAELRRGVLAAGLPQAAVESFFCPIGLPIGSNDPAEIALSVAAQLLERRDAGK